MNIRTNTIMDGYLHKLRYNLWEITIDLPSELKEFIYSDFLTNNDCITLTGLYNHFGNPKLDSDLEKSEWEYNETHFHPDAYVPEGNDEIEYLKYALESAKQLMQRLQREFQDIRFRISVSFMETVYKNDEIVIYGSSTVRFHQIRPACENIMRADDLNNFKTEAVLEIEI